MAKLTVAVVLIARHEPILAEMSTNGVKG
uniref:Uncharacterized protein n=1 Tax=Ralstonia solanacearum TaxID=305 RepID=A0A0S4WZA7_RALSL|nr:protein of unknown function [Ralstonia solanacearum]